MNLKMTSVACGMAFAAEAAFAGIDSMDKVLNLANVSFGQTGFRVCLPPQTGHVFCP